MGILDTCGNSYLNGQGKVYIAQRTSGGAISGEWIEVGNSDSVVVTFDSSYIEHQESCSGQRRTVTRVLDSQTVTMTMNTFNFNRKMLAVALLGEEAAIAGATVTDEAFTLFGSATIIFTDKPDISAVSITNTAGGTALTPTTDYTVDALNGAITFTSTGIAKLTVSGSNFTGLIDYTYAALDKVKGFTGTEKEYAVKFIGINRVDNEAVIANIHRVRMSPANQLSLIGTENSSYEISGLVQPDSTQAAGESQYLTIYKTK